MTAMNALPPEESQVEFDVTETDTGTTPAKSSKARPKSKRVAYKVTLSSAEHEQLLALRDACRSAGLTLGKATLVRAALVLINQQSSDTIAEQMQLLPSLKQPRKPRKKKN